MRGLICVLLAFLMPATLQAQPVQNGQAFGPWRVNCTAVAVGETACVLAQRILRSSDRAFIAQVVAFQSPDGSKTYLSARVPVGVYLPTPFALRPEDGEDVLSFVWQTCGRDLCEALTEISPEALAALGQEDRVILGAFRPSLQAEDFVFRFSLGSATEGLAALRAAPE